MSQAFRGVHHFGLESPCPMGEKQVREGPEQDTPDDGALGGPRLMGGIDLKKI